MDSSSQPKPLSPTALRRLIKTDNTADYGLLDSGGGDESGAGPLSDGEAKGKGKGKQLAETQPYADGGDDTGDLGGEELVSEGDRERRRREKGKGRMQVESAVEDDEGHVAGAHPSPSVPDQGDEDAREEQRIAENLAKWSKAEATRRKSIRRSAALVMPTAPPIPLPSATNLARRSSALIRAGSKRLGRAPPSRNQEDLVDMPVDGTDSRRSQRGASIPLEDRAGTPTTAEQIERLVESPSLSEPSQDPARALTPPPLPPASSTNPFASPPPSPMRTASFDVSRPIDPRHQSRFMEDLPLQSPGTSPTKPTSFVSGLSRSSLDSPLPSPSPSSSSRNPFADRFAQHGKNSRPTELPPHRASQTSLNSQSTIKGAQHRSSNDEEVRTYRKADHEMEARRRERAWEDGEEEEEDDEGGVGLLDWLMCGCFRVRDGDEQVGRTNPNE